MKVIGFDEKYKLQCTCRKCTAIIEYTVSEVQNRRVSCMGDVDTSYYIVCPNCQNEVHGVKEYV